MTGGAKRERGTGESVLPYREGHRTGVYVVGGQHCMQRFHGYPRRYPVMLCNALLFGKRCPSALLL